MFSRLWSWVKGLFKKKEDAPAPSTPNGQEEPAPTSPGEGGSSVPMPAGALYTSGNKIMRGGKVFILRGVNIPDPSYNDIKDWEPDGVGTKFHVDNVIHKFSGVNVIRLPILPGKKGGKEGWLGLGASIYFERYLLPAIEYINSKGIYAIVDFHYLTNWTGLEDETIAFWEYVAPKLGANKMVIFEIFNEPVDPRYWQSLKSKIMQPCIDIIRKYSENLIVVGCPGWSGSIELIDELCTGKNLAYTYHCYSNQYPTKAKSRVEGFMSKHNAPLFLSETGWEEGGTEGGTTEDFGAPFLDYIESKGISWTAWSHSKMWGPRLIDPNSDWQLSESGKHIAKIIKRNLDQ